MPLPSEIAICMLTAPANLASGLPARSLGVARHWTMSLVGSALAHTAIPALLLMVLSATSAQLLSPPSGENSIEIRAVLASDPSESAAESDSHTVELPLDSPAQTVLSQQTRPLANRAVPERPELPEPLADSLPILPPSTGQITVEESQPAEPLRLLETPVRRQKSANQSLSSVAIATVPLTGIKQESLPSPVKQPQPDYPAELLARRVEGVVTLRIKIAADGTVGDCQVQFSSGQPELDQAAVTAVKQWTFLPAKRLGVAVEMEVLKRIRFEITTFTTSPAVNSVNPVLLTK